MSLPKKASYGWRRTRMTLQIKSVGFGQSILPNWLMHKHGQQQRGEQTALAPRERSTRRHVSMNLCIALQRICIKDATEVAGVISTVSG